MQRLACQQHRVVGDIDHVVDRALPRGDQTRPQPQRRGRDRDVVEDARGEAAAQVRALDEDLRALQRPLRAGVLRPGRRRQRRPGGRVQLAGHPVDAEAVGPVGGHLELEQVGGDRQQLSQRSAGAGHRSGTVWSGVERHVVEHEDAGAVEGESQLALGKDHPLRHHPAQVRRLELRSVRHERPGARDRDGLAGGHVGGSAYDGRSLCGVTRPEVHLADLQPIGVAVRLHLEHAADEEAVDGAHPVVMDGLDLRAGHRQPVRDLGGAQAGITVFAQPGERGLHPNCLRKRRSLS